MERGKLREYAGELKTRLSYGLKRNISLQVEVYDCLNHGGIIVIKFINATIWGNTIEHGPFNSLHEALDRINSQHFPTGSRYPEFQGTNIMMESNRIIYVKDANPSEWDHERLLEDVRVVKNPNSDPVHG